MKKIVLILFALIVFFGVFAQTEIRNGVVIDKNAKKIVDNVVLQMKKDTPFSFNFTYNIKDKESKQQGRGKFLSNNASYCIIADKFCHWSNSKTMWNYIKKTNEVEVMDVEDGNTMFNFSKIITNSLKNFRPKFIRKEVFNKVNCNIIDLTPMKSGNISKIRIYSSVRSHRLHKMEISTYSESKYIYIFSDYKANVKVVESNFVFPRQSYPKVKIVDLR